jgi:hypothetical protein
MKCDVCQSHMEDYFDGELECDLVDSVTAHLAGCADCSGLLEELRQEQELYAQYRRDVEVTPALWAAVEARIEQEKAADPARHLTSFRRRAFGMLGRVFATPRLSPGFAAALVLVAVGVTVVVMTMLHSPANNAGLALRNNNSGDELAAARGDANGNAGAATAAVEARPPAPDGASGRKEPGAGTPDNRQAPENKSRASSGLQKQLAASVKPAPQTKVTPERLVREAEQKYVAAIAILSADVNRRRSQIDPMVLARFDSALADIDRTISETRRVVREHPDDPIALQYLLGAYSKKVDVLRDMAAEGQ